MIGAFGLLDGYHPSRFPADRLVENSPRLDVWTLLQHGALTEGAITELKCGPVGCRLASRQGTATWRFNISALPLYIASR